MKIPVIIPVPKRFYTPETLHATITPSVDKQSGEILRELNASAIATFPEEDSSWPYITSNMFLLLPAAYEPGAPQADPPPFIVSFAALYSSRIDFHDWLAKFESFLARLYWDSVILYREPYGEASSQYAWGRMAPRNNPTADLMSPTIRWIRKCYEVERHQRHTRVGASGDLEPGEKHGALAT